MSLKSQAFHAMLQQPQTAANFTVIIPGILTSPLRVNSTSLPQPSREVNEVNFTGIPLPLPGKKKYNGVWKCTISESIHFDSIAQIELLRRLTVPGLGEDPRAHVFINPIIFMTDASLSAIPGYGVVLRGAWLESVNEVRLDWSQPDTPVYWELTFRYTSIINA